MNCNCILSSKNDCSISIIHVRLMIYNIIKVLKSKLRCMNDRHAQKNCENYKNNQSHENMCCALMDCSLTLVMDVVCVIYSFYIVMDHVFIISFAIYTLYVYDRIIKTIYIHFQSIFITYTEVLPIVL